MPLFLKLKIAFELRPAVAWPTYDVGHSNDKWWRNLSGNLRIETVKENRAPKRH